MLNGKFFTGLPPKMMDRSNAGGQNRMESHFFWPDDTKVDTAVESRIKRRNSVQLACTERPLYEKQNSAVNEVDTRKRFSKEFSQSSIQFYDNLHQNKTNPRSSMLRNSAVNRKIEITEKPTNTKLELPDTVVIDNFTAAKKKQAYTSKIEFYDYATEKGKTLETSNNKLLKLKTDLNVKREMELNSKNSPKLQVKRDVRSLSEENELSKINNREFSPLTIPMHNNMNNINEENYMGSRRLVESGLRHSPKSVKAKPTKNHEQNFLRENEIYKEPLQTPYERRKQIYGNHDESGYRRKSEEEGFSPRQYEIFKNNSLYRFEKDDPKSTIRNNSKQYYDDIGDQHYVHESHNELEVRDNMRDVYLNSPPPPPSSRNSHHIAEEYFDDVPQYIYAKKDKIKKPTLRGSSHQHIGYNYKQDIAVDLPYRDYNNSDKRFNTNNKPVNKINNQLRQDSIASPTSPSPGDAESDVVATKNQKHLRSSLCFNNGEIIAENDAAISPTLLQPPAQRRNARSSATQRVSVGLPG